MRSAPRYLAILRLAAAGAAFAGFVFALVLAASPELHTRIHDRAGHHECLAMVLQSGACDDAVPAPTLAAFVATLFEVTVPDGSRTVGSLFLSCRILEHAPPINS
jgi:hypothetical protein